VTQNCFTTSIAAYKARDSYFLEITWGGQDQFIKYSVRALYAHSVWDLGVNVRFIY